MTRHIDLEGIENFRDFGGYDTACGRGLKRGVLFRSGNHARATDADLAALRALGLSTIIDLRRPQERERDPSRRWDGFDGRVIESDTHEDHVDWAEHLRAAPAVDARWFYNDGMTFYGQAPFSARYIELFSRYFHTLADLDGPMVVHCAAGKDRTGMVCAFTHHLAGVHRDDMIADFLLTNDEERISRKMAFLGPWLYEQTGQVMDDETVRTAVSVHADYLDRAFTRIDERYGSLDGYLRDALGVDDALRARIEAKILG